VLAIEQRGEQWQVRTDRETVSAPRVILATGTGAGALCESLNTHLSVLPQVLAWFPIRDPKAYAEQAQQIFLRYESDTKFYGFPSADGWTAKVAASVYLDEVEAYDHPFELRPSYLEPVISSVEKYLPGLEPRPVRTALCADGYLDDHTALLGPVRGLDGIIAAVGLSGHGFKMAPALGTSAAEFAVEGTSRIDVSFMDPNRHLGDSAPLDGVAVR
jgi:sarcosine oxidase